jgi:hypothetical protein
MSSDGRAITPASAGSNAEDMRSMRIPSWRIALTGGAIVVLLGLGIGFAAASTSAPSSPAAADTAPTAAPDATGNPDKPGAGLRKWLHDHPRFAARLGRAKHLVHAVATYTDKDGNLITIQVDHGTIQSVGNGSLTIAEAGGTTVTVSTDDKTEVYVGRHEGTLSDLKVGDTVFVQSRVDGSTLAKHILEVPATASGS